MVNYPEFPDSSFSQQRGPAESDDPKGTANAGRGPRAGLLALFRVSLRLAFSAGFPDRRIL